jgi:hypothetical protein
LVWPTLLHRKMAHEIDPFPTLLPSAYFYLHGCGVTNGGGASARFGIGTCSVGERSQQCRNEGGGGAMETVASVGVRP